MARGCSSDEIDATIDAAVGAVRDEHAESRARPEIARKFRTASGNGMRQVLDLLAEAEIVEFD